MSWPPVVKNPRRPSEPQEEKGWTLIQYVLLGAAIWIWYNAGYFLFYGVLPQ